VQSSSQMITTNKPTVSEDIGKTIRRPFYLTTGNFNDICHVVNSWRSLSSFPHCCTSATPRWWCSRSGCWPARLDSTLRTRSSARSTPPSRSTDGDCVAATAVALGWWNRSV